MSIPTLTPRLILGLNTNISGNVQYINDNDIIYPVGSVVAVHNITLKKQKYIKLAEKAKHLTHVLVSPNKKRIAIVEAATPESKLPTITLWCPNTFRKKKTLLLPQDQDIVAHRYVALDFTFDSMYIAAVTDAPDWTLYFFKCDKGRLESKAKANHFNNTGTVKQVSCNPLDLNQLVLIGDSLIRFLGCQEFNWRQFGYNKTDPIVLTSCCWLAQDRLVIGSSTGRLLLMEHGELKQILDADNAPVIDWKHQDEMQKASEVSLKSISSEGGKIEGEDYQIRAMIHFGRGFAFAYLNGKVHVYEKQMPHKFVKCNVFKLPIETKNFPDNDDIGNISGVRCICINPSNDRLLVTCKRSQFYMARLWTQKLGDVINNKTETMFVEYGYSLHFGPIRSMGTCRWKPWVITAGLKDSTLKLWNYETEELELQQTFEDDVYGVALHPTGLYVMAGFTDKLRYMMVMIDEFISSWEFPIRACQLVRFSNLGHLFAAVNGNVIQVYSSITFDLLYVLKGHNGKITDLSWSENDKLLASCGLDGAVYEWDVMEAKRTSEFIQKSNPLTGTCILRESKGMYAIGLDGRLKHLHNSNIQRDFPLVSKTTINLEAIALSQLDTMLFIAGNKGTVYSIRLPLLEKLELLEFVMHATTITTMCLSFDDRFLISGSSDGSLCIWKLMNAEEKAIEFAKTFDASNEILISRQLLEEKINQINDLQLRMRELQTEHGYQMRQLEVKQDLKMKEVHSGYFSAIEELKEKNEQLEADHIHDMQMNQMEMSKLKESHETFIQKLEASYNAKLIYEYEKHQRLEQKMKKMRNIYEQQRVELEHAKKQSEDDITNAFLEQLKDKDVYIEDQTAHQVKLSKEHELIKQQIEDDADREIYELKILHAKQIKEEQDRNVVLRGEATVIQKKLLISQKETEDLRHIVFSLENEHVKFKSAIVNLEKDIAELKKEIQERDSTIEDKEKRIHTMKGTNQELEKFKLLLDFKIKELKAQIEPKERTIQEQAKQIQEMVNELESLQKVILGLDLHVADLKEKFSASEHEVKREIEKNMRMKEVLKTIRGDIHRASGCIQNIPLLTKTIKDMYHKYNADKDFMVTQAEDTDAKSEFLRQRHFLERTVYTLQQQSAKNANMLSSDKGRLVEENAALLVEANQLRTNLKEETRQNNRIYSLVSTGGLLPRMVQQKIEAATITAEEIHNEYKKTIAENEKVIKALREENEKMLIKLTECESPSNKEEIVDNVSLV